MKGIKKTVPINSKIPDFKFPHYVKISINKNITLFAIEDSSQPLTNIEILFPVGAYSEEIPGLSYFSSQMLKRGTKRRKSMQIAEEFDRLGATLSISSNWDYTKAGFTCLEPYSEKCLDILFDCIFNSTFPKNEIDGFKIKHIADIEQEMADPSYLADIAFNHAVFGRHPYGHPMIGTKSTVNNIKRSDCINWYDKFLEFDNVNIIVSGNFNISRLINLFKKYFSDSITPKSKDIEKNFIYRNGANKIIIKNKKDSEQTNLRIGKPTITRNHPDFPGLQFANTVFGGYFMSRLNKLLREDLGYTYGVSSYVNSKKFASIFVVSTSIKKQATSDTIKKILEQTKLMGIKKISEEEYILVRQYLLGSFIRSTETCRQITGLIKNQIVNNLDENYYNTFYQKVKDISIEEIYECQKKYFTTSDLIITAVGDKKVIGEC